MFVWLTSFARMFDDTPPVTIPDFYPSKYTTFRAPISSRTSGLPSSRFSRTSWSTLPLSDSIAILACECSTSSFHRDGDLSGYVDMMFRNDPFIVIPLLWNVERYSVSYDADRLFSSDPFNSARFPLSSVGSGIQGTVQRHQLVSTTFVLSPRPSKNYQSSGDTFQ